jgi:cupin fold WbuC family metalloprotein
MKIINSDLLNKVSVSAKHNSRLRMNFNFHNSMDAKSQRMLNALEPGTEIPIHRHMNTYENYIILRGKLKVLFYNDSHKLVNSVTLDSDIGNFGIEIPMGQWHSIEVLQSGTVIFEVKDGPYCPIVEENIKSNEHSRMNETHYS